MNKKAFTLVELLAAITILALLAIVTVPAVTRPVKESKQDLYESQLKIFKESAKGWGAENMYSALPSYDDSNNCLLLPLQTLVDEGLVDPDTKNPLDGSKFVGTTNGVFIKIENTGTDSNKYVYNVYDCSNNCYNPDDKKNHDYESITNNESCSVYSKE